MLTARHPELTTTEQRKDKRTGPVYMDVMRNAYAQTVVAPYVVRARPGAHVAVPLDWDEVADRTLTPGRFTLRTVRRRLSDRGRAADPWSGLARHRQGLAKAQARLDQLAGG